MASRWVNDPPIKELTADEFDAELKKFSTNLDSWSKPRSNLGDNILAKVDAQVDFANSTVPMLQFRRNIKGIKFYTYRVTGAPVALAICKSEANPYELDTLLGSAAASHAGNIMLEYVVNLAKAATGKPIVRLTSRDAASTSFYAGFGFKAVPKTDSDMELDASQDSGWVDVSGTWRIKAFQNLQYAG